MRFRCPAFRIRGIAAKPSAASGTPGSRGMPTVGWLLPVLCAWVMIGGGEGVGFAAEADLGGVAQEARKDVEAALAELAAVRAEVEAAVVPLAREVSGLEQRVIDQRLAVQKAERFHENALVELNALKAQARARADEVKFVDALLAEYERSFRVRTHVAEQERWAPMLERVAGAAASTELSMSERLVRRTELVKTAIARLRGAAGGEVFDGRVLSPEGRLEPGRVVLVGPVGLFAAREGGVVGVIQQELNKADPTAFPLPPGLAQGVRELAAGGAGRLAVDPTLGNAAKIASTKESLGEHIAKGGVVMWPILGMAVVALVVAVAKWVQLSRVRLASAADLQLVLNHLRQRAPDRAVAHARTIPGPAGVLLATAVEHADEKKEYLEEVLYERMLAAKPGLESLLPFIALTAAAAPLLGLLGTVTGMISTFNMISLFGTGDPKTLSGGISEALITTEFGLYVAIPAVMAHAFLSRKAKGVLGSMEQTAVGFINGIPDRAAAEVA